MQRERPLALVIEDDQAARRLYVAALQGGGLAVAEAHNGLQAVEKAQQLLPDVIVTDLGLPGIDGYELCRRLQHDARTQAIPILAITGRYISAADVTRARRDGCEGVLIKPFAGDDLVDEVRRVLHMQAG